jgi:5-methyltetrahydrofolate--homocysteine methyltransferase
MEQLLGKRILVMDGAMGTLIPSASKDALNLTAPEQIQAIHRQYLEAGADIVKTNTFNSNSGPQDYAVNVAGARLARAVADEFTARFVAGSMGPGSDGAASVDAYFDQARALVEGGVDILLAETITSIRTAEAALTAYEKLFAIVGRALPVMLSVTVSKDGSLLSGETLRSFWNSVSSRNPFSVGINCGYGARHTRTFVEQLAEIASSRVSWHPSAGMPDASGGYDETPEVFAASIAEVMTHHRVTIVGGCCGTTPAHIRAIAEISRVTINNL